MKPEFEDKIREAIEIELMDLSITDTAIQEITDRIYANIMYEIKQNKNKKR
jgi:hypothetical protein